MTKQVLIINITRMGDLAQTVPLLQSAVLSDRHRPLDGALKRLPLTRSHQSDLAAIGAELPRIGVSTCSRKGDMPGLGLDDGGHVIEHHSSIRSREVEVYPIAGFHSEDIHPEHQGG
jgi:hypothetical protein